MTGATARLFHSRVLRESGSAAEDPSPSSTTAIFAADSSSDFVDLEKDEVVERETAEYACEDDGFLVGDRVYNKQYAHLYYQRLARREFVRHAELPFGCRARFLAPVGEQALDCRRVDEKV